MGLTSVFADTSALFAFLVETDDNHRSAVRALESLAESDASLVSTSYVMAETISLLASRTGLDAVRAFREEIAPMLRVVWVESSLHEEGLESLLSGKRRRLSLVDCVSFAAMRREGIAEAWAYDRHFRDGGFTLVK